MSTNDQGAGRVVKGHLAYAIYDGAEVIHRNGTLQLLRVGRDNRPVCIGLFDSGKSHLYLFNGGDLIRALSQAVMLKAND